MPMDVLSTLSRRYTIKTFVMSIDSINFVLDRADGVAVPLYDEEGQPNIRNAIAFSVLKDAIVDIPDMYHESNFDFSAIRYRQHHGYQTIPSL